MTVDPIPWWAAEPARLQRDRDEIAADFPSLSLTLDGQGCWTGELPLWPFNRAEPARLTELLDGNGLLVEIAYTAAYPMMFPFIYPRRPEPCLEEWTQARFHVLGNGALCLFQSVADWDPASSITDLIHKAAGWHIEYALLNAGLIEDMSLVGIVNDECYDALVPEAVERRLALDPQS